MDDCDVAHYSTSSRQFSEQASRSSDCFHFRPITDQDVFHPHSDQASLLSDCFCFPPFDQDLDLISKLIKLNSTVFQEDHVFIPHHHGYLDEYSSGLGFCIRILPLLAWSNSRIPMTNNLIIIIDQMVMLIVMIMEAII